jgi:hypothetical protein
MKICLCFFLLSGCSFFIGGNEAPKTAKGSLYSISFQLPDWQDKKEKKSDYIFENTKDGRILLSNSFCDEFQDQPLSVLATKTFNSVKSFKTKISEYQTFNDREAYRIEGAGLVDGVKVNLRLLNTRRDHCYFDFVAIIPSGSQENDNAFEKFLKAVDFK